MTRECGSCTACCRLVPVREIGLPSFTRCPKLAEAFSAKPGCSIYANRPHSCRLWSCMWLLNDWGDELRPDRCGIVFDEIPDVIKAGGTEMPCVQAWVAPGYADKIEEEPIAPVWMAILDKGAAVLFRTGPRSAFAVFKHNGKLCRSAEVEPETTEPDSIRLVRARKLIDAL